MSNNRRQPCGPTKVMMGPMGPRGPMGPMGPSGTVSSEEILKVMEEEPKAARMALGLDDGNGNLLVNGVVMPDTGGVAMAENSLGFNSKGHVYRADGATDGNKLPSAKLVHRIASAVTVSQTEAQASGGYFKSFGSFHVPAADAVIGSRWRMTGSYSEKHDVAAGAMPCFFGLCPELSIGPGAAGGVGPVAFIASNLLSVSIPFFTMEVELVDHGGGYYRIATVSNGLLAGHVFYAAAVGAASMDQTTAYHVGTEAGEVGVPTEFHLIVGSSESPTASGIQFAADVTFEKL